jgi:hypothetical protein
MRPTRLLAYLEHYDCSHGHALDVWILPRAPGATVETLRRCPTCETMFVLTTLTPHTSGRPTIEAGDDSCPNCRTPLSQSHPYPEMPHCRECAERVRTWLANGPDLPASAASTIRCWAVVHSVVPDDVDLRVTVAAEVHRTPRARRA